MDIPGITQANSAVEAILAAVEGVQRGMPSLRMDTFATPTPPTLKLTGVDVSGIEDALQPPLDGVEDVGTPASVNLPNLTVPAFTGASDAINLAFNAPVLGAVQYKDGISAPSPTYGTSTDAPGFAPSAYAGGVTPPDVDVAYQTIPELGEVTLLDIARYTLGNTTLEPIAELVIPTPPVVALDPGGIEMDKLDSKWVESYKELFKDHMHVTPYMMYMEDSSMETYVEAKTRPQRVALMSKRRAILAAHAARGFNSAVGAATYEFTELAREEADMIVAANDEARREIQQFVGAGLLAAADSGMKLERSVMDIWTKWAMTPVQLAGKYNSASIQMVKSLVGLYNNNVSLIAEHVQAYQAYASAGRNIVQAQITEATQDQYIAENYANIVELYRAKTKHWVSQVKQYAVKVKGATLPIEAYQVYIASIMIDAQIARSNISMYADAVSTFGERTKLYADNLELWATAYRADASKLDVDLANIQAYKQAVGQEQDRVRAYLQYIDASTDAFTAKTSVLNASLQANTTYLQTLGDLVGVAKDYTALSSQAVTANARAQAGVASAEAAYKSGQFSVRMNKYATDLAVIAANNQIEVANQTYKKQGDQVRMAAIGSYLQGLYSSVVQSVSADVRYSGETQFSGSESLSEDSRSSWSQSVKNTNRYVIEPSV